ncbi:MAG: hypothetical protein AAF682_27095 [Planctomycetota bacterium]
MLRSNRGAARVSIMWIITAGVLFLAAVVFAFVASSDLAKEREAKDRAIQDKLDAEQLATTASQYARSLSEAVGWYDADSADPRADIEALGSAIADLRDTFPDLAAEDNDFQKVLPKIKASFNAKNRELADRQTRIQSLQSELTVKDGTVSSVTSEKDARIAALTQQLADETQTAATRNEELETRLMAADQKASDRDLDFRRSQNDIANQSRDFDKERLTLETRIGELSSQLRFKKDPFHRYPDGKILSVSDALPLGWIDIGSQDRVVRGIRFRVEGGTPGERKVKGWAEVTRVEASMAEVRILDEVDGFDPVVAGDVILNPLFDPAGGRNAILVGRFSGTHTKKEVAQLLEAMGIRVQDKLDLTTTFMIVGAPLYTDPDTGEPREEPLEPSELPEYKDAEAIGVQVVPLSEIREFFKVDTAVSQG